MKEAVISLLANRNTMSLEMETIAKKLNIKNKSQLQQVLNKLERV